MRLCTFINTSTAFVTERLVVRTDNFSFRRRIKKKIFRLCRLEEESVGIEEDEYRSSYFFLKKKHEINNSFDVPTYRFFEIILISNV